MPGNLHARERDWAAEDDARTLMNADVIKKDPKRLKAASAMAKKMEEKKIQEAVGMKKVADMKPGKNKNAGKKKD